MREGSCYDDLWCKNEILRQVIRLLFKIYAAQWSQEFEFPQFIG